MPSNRRTPIALALPLLWATTAVFAAEPTATTTAAKSEAKPEGDAKVDLKQVADDDALELDVLAVVSLPLAADDARDAGMPADEVADVVDAVADVGASPAVATDLLVAETAQVRKQGAKQHFASWVRGQLAAGAQNQQMLATIEKREAEYIALSAAERQALDRKLIELRKAAVEARKAEWMEIDRLRKAGKKLRVAGSAKLGELRTRVVQSVERQKRIEAAIAADPAKRAAFNRAIAKIEKAVDAAGKAIDKAQDMRKPEPAAEKKAEPATKGGAQ